MVAIHHASGAAFLLYDFTMPVHIERRMRCEQMDIQEKRAGQFPLVWRREDLRRDAGACEAQVVGSQIEGSPLKDGGFEIGDRVGAQQVIEKSILTGS
jgi:hypothetical protein